jgi:hypothetical protein
MNIVIEGRKAEEKRLAGHLTIRDSDKYGHPLATPLRRIQITERREIVIFASADRYGHLC